LLKTMIYEWQEVFRPAFPPDAQHRARSLVTLALDARNAAAHAEQGITDIEGLRALDAMGELLRLAGGPADALKAIEALHAQQRRLGGLPAPQENVARVRSLPVSRGRETLADRLLAYVRANPGLDDDELHRRLGTPQRQAINQAARKLEAAGLIERRTGPRAKIINLPR
jgi:hypothetical protein